MTKNSTLPRRLGWKSCWRPGARWPSAKSDSINVWDDVVTTRALLLEKLNERFAKYWEKEVSRFEHLIEGRGEAASGVEAGGSGAVKRERTEDDDDNDEMVIVETQGVRTLKKVKQHLLSEREAFYRQMADGARKQSNFYVADTYMKLSLKAGKALQVPARICFCFSLPCPHPNSRFVERPSAERRARRRSTSPSSIRWSSSTA